MFPYQQVYWLQGHFSGFIFPCENLELLIVMYLKGTEE